jgi:signal transduction histidine kinase
MMAPGDQRLYPTFAIALLALLVGAGLILRGLVERAVARDTKADLALLDLALRDRSRYLADVLQTRGGSRPWPENLAEVLTRSHADYNRDIFVQVFEVDGRLVAESANTPAGVALSPTTLNEGPRALRWITADVRDSQSRPLRLVTYPVYRGDPTDPAVKAIGYAQAGLPLPDPASTVRRVTWILAGTLGALGLLCLVAMRWLVSSAARSLKQEAEAMQAAQHRFLGDAAHELGTPLAILRGEIDIALRRERGASEYRDALASCREEIERLSRLSENLLALASADSGASLIELELCDASAVARTVHARFASVASERQIDFCLQAPDSIPWRADSVAIEQVLSNLVANALRHTPAQETVELDLTATSGEIVFTVRDTGEGIPAAHLLLIFERFHRVDKARSRHAGGAGLGLALVKTLVEAHRGSIGVQSELGKGTTFTVRFPT